MATETASPSAMSRRRAQAFSDPPAGLDAILTDPAISTRERLLTVLTLLRVPLWTIGRPNVLAPVSTELLVHVLRILAGRGDLEPSADDRFEDPTWTENPAFRRLAQVYLASCHAVDRAITNANLEWRQERRVRLVFENLLDAAAPTNFPATNPAVLKRTLETGGLNFARGARNLVRDLRQPPRLPAMVDRTAFEVGRDLAVTPGAVVRRTPMMEVIQYASSTPTVHEVPVLIVAPMVNKFYVVDMRPGRSLVQYLLEQGFQVFITSWRNPTRAEGHWNLDSYTGAVLEALDTVEDVTASARSHLLGFCAGGLLACTLTNVLDARGQQDRVATVTLGVCPVDSTRPGIPGSIVTKQTAGIARGESARRGYISAEVLARTFAALRPNEAIWRFYIRGYLLGEKPPAHDILFWNADATNMSAGLHHDLVRSSMTNAFVNPRTMSVLDVPIDLGRITADAYVMAGIADHIVPWQGCYSAVQALGSEARFVLSESGHVGAIVTPTTSKRARFWRGPTGIKDPVAWLDQADLEVGSWWADWSAWLEPRSGATRPGPPTVGSDTYPAGAPAPGDYVLRKGG